MPVCFLPPPGPLNPLTLHPGPQGHSGGSFLGPLSPPVASRSQTFAIVELCRVDRVCFELRRAALLLNDCLADVFRDEQEAEGVSQG